MCYQNAISKSCYLEEIQENIKLMNSQKFIRLVVPMREFSLVTRDLLSIDINKVDRIQAEEAQKCRASYLRSDIFQGVSAFQDIQGTTKSPFNNQRIYGQIPLHSIKLRGWLTDHTGTITF
ncbi:hypothetical protein NPIL_145741 [Nephila pilipes]|uniref:Uncharacterized protein n=1 Tax=Nephila pilipes TaxID=299642 RepID=A0A8X6U870_NEPPI|nr:hypothetical protein NPIL_145741 [Nephila pilipes]